MRLIERQVCPICGDSDFKTVYKEPYSSLNLVTYINKFYGDQGYPVVEELSDDFFQIDECIQCEMLFQRYVPDNDSLTELYTKWISFDKVYDLYERQRPLHKLDKNYLMLRTILSHLGTRQLKCFDYGFGYAHLLKQAQLLGFESYGTEFNMNQISLAKRQNIKIIDFEKSSNITPMDVIFCEQVLEHAVSPRLIMKNIQKLAKEGTILHLSVPDSARAKKILQHLDWSNMRGNKHSVMCIAPLEHINSFQHKNLVALGEDFGFRRIQLDRNFKIAHEVNNLKSYIKYQYRGLTHLTNSILRNISGYQATDLFFKYQPN